MSYLSIFGLEFEHNIAILEISTLEFVKNEFFTHAINFGTGFAFLKVRVRVRVRFINYSLLKALQISHKKVNKAVVLLCKSQDILPTPAFLTFIIHLLELILIMVVLLLIQPLIILFTLQYNRVNPYNTTQL